MIESKPLSKAAYQKILEKKKTSELIEILNRKGQRASSNITKQKLIDRIINLSKNTDNTPKIEIDWRTKSNVDKNDISDMIKNITLSIAAIIFIQVIFIFIRFIYAIMFPKLDYCDSNSNNSKCIRCPGNAVCSNKKMKCNENFTFLKGLCLPNCSDSEQLFSFIQLAKYRLKQRTGLYKCHEVRVDFMSQDEIENILFIYYHKTQKNISNYLKLTIEYLMNETDIITKDVNNSSVFISKDYITSKLCFWKSIFLRNTPFFLIAIIANLYLYYKKKKSKYEVQAIQCLTQVLNYLKSFNGNEVSQQSIKSFIDPMVDDVDSVWKYIRNKLKNSMSVGCKKEGGQIYYFYID